MEFRVIAFSSFSDVNVLNDNIDINVIFPNGDVFFATLITIQNIQQLMDGDSFFWIDAMLIVSSLDKENIKRSIIEIIENNYFEKIFSKIGNLKTLDGYANNYEDLDNHYSNFAI